MSDHLAALPPPQVAAWYRRLADRIGRERIDSQEPLASRFLRHWLDNRPSAAVLHFEAPDYVRTSSYVRSALRFQRAVFLTVERARFTGAPDAWAGVLPRIQGARGFTRWDLRAPLAMHYESLVEVGSNAVEIAWIRERGTPGERDMLTALRGFQLRSEVTVTGRRQTATRVRIQFSAWSCRVRDRYDWDYTEHFTVPNPDYGAQAPDAVRPQDRTITVYHSNARRVEEAGLAAPYDLESNPWAAHPDYITPAEVDASRRL